MVALSSVLMNSNFSVLFPLGYRFNLLALNINNVSIFATTFKSTLRSLLHHHTQIAVNPRSNQLRLVFVCPSRQPCLG